MTQITYRVDFILHPIKQQSTLALRARLIPEFPSGGVVTVNRVILKPEYTIDDLQERVAYEMLWSGKACNEEEAAAAISSKEKYNQDR